MLATVIITHCYHLITTIGWKVVDLMKAIIKEMNGVKQIETMKRIKLRKRVVVAIFEMRLKTLIYEWIKR